MKVHQLLAALSYGDAIGNEALAIQRQLRAAGHESDIFAELVHDDGSCRVFLPRLTGWNAARREAAARYAELGLGEAVDLPADELGHVYHMYVVRSSRRGEISTALSERGIASASYYVTPLHLQPALAFLGHERGSLPETERMAAENLALPMWGCIGTDVQERVVEAVRSAVGVPA